MTRPLQKALALFGAITGAVAAAGQLLTAPNIIVRNISLAVLFAAAVVLLLMVVVPELRRIRRAVTALPSDEELDDLGAKYTVVAAATDDITWTAQHETEVYSADDAIPERLLREWYAANPTGFSVIKTVDGKRVGHLNILPLRPRTCEAIVAGDIVEREIRGDSLFSIHERESIIGLYIESVGLCVPKPLSNTAAIAAILSSLPDVVARVAEPGKVEFIYAIAASKPGECLMRRFGFEVLRPAERRKDAYDLFRAPWQTVADRARALSH